MTPMEKVKQARVLVDVCKANLRDAEMRLRGLQDEQDEQDEVARGTIEPVGAGDPDVLVVRPPVSDLRAVKIPKAPWYEVQILRKSDGAIMSPAELGRPLRVNLRDMSIEEAEETMTEKELVAQLLAERARSAELEAQVARLERALKAVARDPYG